MNYYCWTCQCLICTFCVQEHQQYKHRTYSLISTPKYLKDKKSIHKEELKTKTSNVKPIQSIETKAQEKKESSNRIIKSTEENRCMRCHRSVKRGDLKLNCNHWVHNQCIKE